MSIIYLYDEFIRIPPWVVDHASFRRWLHSDEFPEKGRICYLNGEVWADMTGEQLYTHNQVKTEFTFVLVGLTRASGNGLYFSDGALLSNAEMDFTSGPDGIYVAYESLESGNVRQIEGTKAGFVELEGAPEMVLEVVSDSSVEKDTVTLRQLYCEAGIKEYWLVDVRADKLEFDILRHTSGGYAATRKQGGWLKSAVFGKSFKLTRQTDRLGNPGYRLAVR
jgi:Uma2 family endonuclease